MKYLNQFEHTLTRPRRKPNRLKNYDYSNRGAYFVTICAKNLSNLFGKIAPATHSELPAVTLTPLGSHIKNAIEYYINNPSDSFFDCYVIMPNHVHIVIFISPVVGDRGRSPLQIIIRSLKAYVTKQIKYSPWQKSFHDHIIRNETSYLQIVEYIRENPTKWQEDRYYTN